MNKETLSDCMIKNKTQIPVIHVKEFIQKLEYWNINLDDKRNLTQFLIDEVGKELTNHSPQTKQKQDLGGKSPLSHMNKTEDTNNKDGSDDVCANCNYYKEFSKKGVDWAECKKDGRRLYNRDLYQIKPKDCKKFKKKEDVCANCGFPEVSHPLSRVLFPKGCERMRDITKWKHILNYIKKMGFEINRSNTFWDAKTGLALISFKINVKKKENDK